MELGEGRRQAWRDNAHLWLGFCGRFRRERDGCADGRAFTSDGEILLAGLFGFIVGYFAPFWTKFLLVAHRRLYSEAMSSNVVFDDIWTKAKDILLPFEGAASQVYVLDLPITELFRIGKEFCRRANAARLTTFAGVTTSYEEAPDVDESLLAELAAATDYSIIFGEYSGELSVQFWIWPMPQSATFDAEFVFFADQASDDDVRAAFEQVAALAEMARENSPASECVLSGSETGDPRQQRDRSWTLWW